MVRCSTPDTLIGLGGGGSRVVYRFMQQRWILDEVLDNGPSNGDHGPDTLRATTIDTAINDDWHDDKKKNVEDVISAAISDSDYEEEDRYLEFEGPTIIPNELTTGWKKEMLTSPKSIGKLRDDTGLNSWWLKNGRDPLDNVNEKGFDSGVDRLRAVSKSLYHIADHTGVETVKVRPEGTAVIVTSLGGGTGSGLALDLAADLAPDVDEIHLFGVLPRDRAGADLKANAHAALSEFEYSELTGEGPFDSITLIPHLDEVSEKNQEFEMAVIRTMIARLNGGDNIKKLRPRGGDQASAPAYAPFTFAYPVTLRYDFEAKEQAKDVVERTLDDKRTELRKESDLYDVVKQYLRESFADTAGAELESQDQGRLDIGSNGLSRVAALQDRIEEDLYEDFLSDDALKVADLSETVEQIQDEFENHFDDEKIGITENATDAERAKEFVELVPERLKTTLENNFEFRERDGSKYKLVEALKLEIENVKDRRDIRKAVSRITAEENEGLTEAEAEVFRNGLLNVVLRDDVTFLAEEITNDRVQDQIGDLRKEVSELTERQSDLEELWAEVARDIRSKRNTWYDKVSDDASRLAAVNKNRQTLQQALDDLSKEIEQKCREINSAGKAELERISLDLSRIGPLGSESDEINGIAPINSKLEEIGIDKIPARTIEDGFEQVKRARRLEIEHGSGLLSPNNEEEFANAVERATKDGWFKINSNRRQISVEDEFKCEFDSPLQVSDDIDQAEEEAIDAIADAFTEAFTDQGQDSFPKYSIEPSGGYGKLTVPQGSSVITVRESLETGLRASTKTELKELLDDVMPVGDINPEEPSTDVFDSDSTTNSGNRGAMLQLVDAYLHPIGEEIKTVSGRISRLTDSEDEDGLITRLEKLRGLAEGHDVVSVELPKANRGDKPSETYGKDYSENYGGIYDFDLENTFQYEGNENPYVVPMKTDPSDLANDPNDIGDTTIVEDGSDEIERKFRQQILDLIESSNKAPFSLNLRGTAQKTGDTAYTDLRIRQVYLSRGYDSLLREIDTKYDQVYNEIEKVLPLSKSNDIYDGDQYPFGWTDDVSMVTFVGGIFLDNIELVHGMDGYKEMYEETYGESSFPGSHHTIGLGAMWDRWSAMGEWVSEEWERENLDSDADFGGYVYRSELHDPDDQDFIEEINYLSSSEDESAKDLFLDALAADAYENTVPLESDEGAETGSELD